MTPPIIGLLTDGPASFLLAGARVIDPAAGTEEIRDLAVLDGRFVDPGRMPETAERIDGRGLLVMPGLCDLHVHLRTPGDSAAETIASGTRAAARGGFTTVCAMPNTEPPLDNAEGVAAVLQASGGAACRVRVIGAATEARAGQRPADLRGMVQAGAVAFSDDGAAVPTDALLGEVIELLHELDRPLIEHAEDRALAGDGVMRAGVTATRLGLAGWPDAAEVSIVHRDLARAASTGARIHLTHVSRAASIEAIRRAKAAGVRVTCDVTPHHLAFSDTWVAGDRAFAWEPERVDRSLAYDASCRVNPPLGSRDDAAALRAGLEDGTVDAIATDHAPHPAPAKLVPFDAAAPGLIGLETALSVGLAAVEAGALELGTLVAALSSRPAAIIGEPRGFADNTPADLALVDPTARWRVDASALASRSSNTPLVGMTLPGVVRLTVADGRITHRHGV